MRKSKELSKHFCAMNDDIHSCDCFVKGQRAERKEWLNGLRCHSCGKSKELNMLSSICKKCWEES